MYRMIPRRNQDGFQSPRQHPSTRQKPATPTFPGILLSGAAVSLVLIFAVWAIANAVSVSGSGPVGSGANGEQKYSPPPQPSTASQSPGSETWWPQKGSYLVALVSTECSHCQQAVPNLNAYATDRKLPPLHALCYNEPWQVVVFKKQWGARFQVHRTTFDLFMQHLGQHHTPCVHWVTDGKIRLSVEPPLPSPEELRRQIQRAVQSTPPVRKSSGNTRKAA